MIDIEDLDTAVNSFEIGLQRKSTGKVLGSYVKKEAKTLNPYLPGQASVYVKTWGCGHNNSDGEYMSGLLAEQGYNVILTSENAGEGSQTFITIADVWLLNSCTVKGPSQQTFGNDIKRGLDSGKKVIVAGCVPQGNHIPSKPRRKGWGRLAKLIRHRCSAN